MLDLKVSVPIFQLIPSVCIKALDDLFHFFFQDLCRWDWSSPITLQGTQGTSNAPGSAPPNTLVLLPGNSHGRPPVPASGKVSEAVPWLRVVPIFGEGDEGSTEIWFYLKCKAMW